MIDGIWLPESEEEEVLLGEIFRATRRANARGVSRRRIASLLAFQAAAALDPKATDSTSVDSEETPSGPVCPQCETKPEAAMGQVGSSEVKLSCGHWVDLENLNGEKREFFERLVGGRE